MKLTKFILSLVLVLTMAISLASCDELEAQVQNAIDEATAPLTDTIEALEATKTELENAKATLEAAKTELENAKAQLEDEKVALENRIEGLLDCAEGKHDMTIIANSDGSHTNICSYCELGKTESCNFLDYVDNGDGSYTATCPTCGNTHTGDSSILFVVVTTEDELNSATNTDGAKVKLGADIDLADCIHIDYSVQIDLAGHSINTNDPSVNEFFVFGSLYIFDSVGGGSVGNGFNTYEETFLKIGDINISPDNPIGTDGTIDLSEYRGGELTLYVGYFADLILPEGYLMYDEMRNYVLADFEAAKEEAWIIISPAAE